MAEFYAGCATAHEMLLARDVLMFFGCRVETSLRMDSAAARGICRRDGCQFKVKALEVRTLVVAASDQSKDTVTQDSEVTRQLCCPWYEDVDCRDTDFTQIYEWFGGQERGG